MKAKQARKLANTGVSAKTQNVFSLYAHVASLIENCAFSGLYNCEINIEDADKAWSMVIIFNGLGYKTTYIDGKLYVKWS